MGENWSFEVSITPDRVADFGARLEFASTELSWYRLLDLSHRNWDIPEPPTDVLLREGGSFSFGSSTSPSIHLPGAAARTMTVLKNGQPVSEQSIASTTVGDSGQYQVRYSDGRVTRTTRPFWLGVLRADRALGTVLATPGTTVNLLAGLVNAQFQWWHLSAAGVRTEVTDQRLGLGQAATGSSSLIFSTPQPSDAGRYTCTVTLGTATLEMGPWNVTLTPPPVGLPSLNMTAFSWAVAQTVKEQLTATASPLRWRVRGLPPGLTVDASGCITGTPKVAGAFRLEVSAFNANGEGPRVTIPVTVQALPAYVIGQFSLLLPNESDVTDGRGGMLRVSVSSTGQFTGKVQIGSWSGAQPEGFQTYPLRGNLVAGSGIFGHCAITRRGGAGRLDLELHFIDGTLRLIWQKNGGPQQQVNAIGPHAKIVSSGVSGRYDFGYNNGVQGKGTLMIAPNGTSVFVHRFAMIGYPTQVRLAAGHVSTDGYLATWQPIPGRIPAALSNYTALPPAPGVGPQSAEVWAIWSRSTNAEELVQFGATAKRNVVIPRSNRVGRPWEHEGRRSNRSGE